MNTSEEQALQEALDAEKSGDRYRAGILFERLYTKTHDLQWLHRAAINSRYYDTGHAEVLYRELEILLQQKITTAAEPAPFMAHMARMQRDLALLYLGNRNFTLANTMLRMALQGHSNEPDEFSRRTERGATHGVFGRMYLAMGDHRKAERSFRRADVLLAQGSNREYELFNLVHILELPSLSEALRLSYRQRAERLAEQLGYHDMP